MIDDLDRTLEALLRHGLPEEISEQVAITFIAPDGQFPPSSIKLPAIDLFLYDLRENLDRRTNEWAVERGVDGTVSKKRPVVRVDCSYVITAWVGGKDPILGEHRILGEVLQVLLGHREIPDHLLRGRLSDLSPRAWVLPLQPVLLQSIGEFWQAMGGQPKAALNYSVTVTSDPFPTFTVPAVTETSVLVEPGLGGAP